MHDYNNYLNCPVIVTKFGLIVFQVKERQFVYGAKRIILKSDTYMFVKEIKYLKQQQ